MFKTISLALAAASIVAAPVAFAQERETRSTDVTYHDLDLGTEAGVAELNRRIDSAAKQVCGMYDRELGTNIVSRESRQCYRSTKRQLEEHFAAVIASEARGG